MSANIGESTTQSPFPPIDRARVFEIVQNELSQPQPTETSPEVKWDTIHAERVGRRIIYYTDQGRADIIGERCEALRQAAQNERCHVAELNTVFSRYVETHVESPKPRVQSVTDGVCAILSRLPQTPSVLQDPPLSVPQVYFDELRTWEDLRVVKCVPHNFIRLVASLVISQMRFPARGGVLIAENFFEETSNGVGELFDAIHAKESNAILHGDSKPYSWFVVRAFLWNFWQKANLLYRYYDLKLRLDFGFQSMPMSAWTHNFLVSPGTSLLERSTQLSWEQKPENRCTWSFKMVQVNPLCLGLDSRLLHRRFSGAFHGTGARCRSDSESACEGTGPNCLRHRGALISDQSAHASSCSCKTPNEFKLAWNESSYLQVDGPRAVSVNETNIQNDGLHYCCASDTTLAISHVWSHGQGGRPETGINKCLHARYSQIAKSMGCESYWMDVVSIPGNHELRQEAISHINGVFSNSRAVLVCDRDLMLLDVSKLTTDTKERILVATLFSDWNGRAWTILESWKGRRKIFLLCKNDSIVDFREAVFDVFSNGRIDIAVFANLFPHLLPSAKERNKSLGFTEVNIAIAGSWLSHRPASRTSDEFVIWSLLIDEERSPCYNAEDFWRAQSSVSTGYLMSSIPRLNVKGLTWAPSTPYALAQPGQPSQTIDPIQPPIIGWQDDGALIEKDGLWGKWYSYEFRFRFRTAKQILRGLRHPTSGVDSSIERELERIQALLDIREKHVVLLQRVTERHLKFMSDINGRRRLVVVCESDKKERKRQRDRILGSNNSFPISYRWQWKGVYEWPENVAMPQFETNSTWQGTTFWIT
ncbi:hypothetical protein EPUS_05016 [Endocarpon pusillum Z07020]|uniref:Heterokaryon incompatibility domain-containing protein n=1 Tax=Endocarpon pusillum (strain Z07020 / HMAS-L-300199) TaxID=1263415 RepID=U1HR32_ENDPU|nr:uncharacterized protein EPUS_05016 [Endocarpon pusillum Z07020]ERF72935.1 hypothetical protein EPUS_05016 [Endocarpon pusillum Z07020]